MCICKRLRFTFWLAYFCTHTKICLSIFHSPFAVNRCSLTIQWNIPSTSQSQSRFVSSIVFLHLTMKSWPSNELKSSQKSLSYVGMVPKGSIITSYPSTSVSEPDFCIPCPSTVTKFTMYQPIWWSRCPVSFISHLPLDPYCDLWRLISLFTAAARLGTQMARGFWSYPQVEFKFPFIICLFSTPHYHSYSSRLRTCNHSHSSTFQHKWSRKH